MRIYNAQFAASLTAARDGGIAPVWFFWVQARDRTSEAEVWLYYKRDIRGDTENVSTES